MSWTTPEEMRRLGRVERDLLINGFKSGPRYIALVKQAVAKRLMVPPYGNEAEGIAFLNGYETALSDLANDRLSDQ